LGALRCDNTHQNVKVFCFFFSKKKCLLAFSYGRMPLLRDLLSPLAAAAGLGLLAAAALPPLNLVPLLFVAIPGLLVLIGRAPKWRGALLRGLVFGWFHHLAGLYWVTNAILVMAAEFWWAVPIAVPLLALVMALFIAVPCALARLAAPGWRRLAVLAGAWVLGDLARQFALSGFPWNLLATCWEMPGRIGAVFIQPAAWLGAHGLTLATLLVCGSLALKPRLRFAGMAALVAWGIAGFLRLQAPVPRSGLTAVIAQGNISEADHRDHGRDPIWANGVFDGYLALTRKGVAEAVRADPAMRAIVVWPETASPFALAQDAGARQAVAEAAGTALMTIAGTERFESATVAHNSLVAVAPDGSLAGVYDKAHLVPYGEYFPSYAHFMLGEQGFTPGPGIRTLHLAGLPAIGPLICYEVIFPAQVVDEADRPSLLVNITNDAWFGDSAGPRQHLAAARLRSVEEGLPMVRAANTGISAVIDPFGRLNARLGLDRRGVLVAPIPGPLPPTPAGRLGLLAPFILSLLCCGLGFLWRSPDRAAHN
jgi:apolipoprotein N-acyltransferase